VSVVPADITGVPGVTESMSAAWERAARPCIVIPVASGDPSPRVAASPVRDEAGELLHRGRRAQIDALQLEPARHEVGMVVDEAREDQASLEIDDGG